MLSVVQTLPWIVPSNGSEILTPPPSFDKEQAVPSITDAKRVSISAKIQVTDSSGETQTPIHQEDVEVTPEINGEEETPSFSAADMKFSLEVLPPQSQKEDPAMRLSYGGGLTVPRKGSVLSVLQNRNSRDVPRSRRASGAAPEPIKPIIIPAESTHAETPETMPMPRKTSEEKIPTDNRLPTEGLPVPSDHNKQNTANGPAPVVHFQLTEEERLELEEDEREARRLAELELTSAGNGGALIALAAAEPSRLQPPEADC